MDAWPHVSCATPLSPSHTQTHTAAASTSATHRHTCARWGAAVRLFADHTSHNRSIPPPSRGPRRVLWYDAVKISSYRCVCVYVCVPDACVAPVGWRRSSVAFVLLLFPFLLCRPPLSWAPPPCARLCFRVCVCVCVSECVVSLPPPPTASFLPFSGCVGTVLGGGGSMDESCVDPHAPLSACACV